MTRSLPQCRHTVAFLSSVNAQTREAFGQCRIGEWDAVTVERVRRVSPDVVLLHNTPQGRVERRLPAVTLQYLHSRIDPARADETTYCSRWLAGQYGADGRSVCYQGVPRPPRSEGAGERRALREFPVIGRICTPQRKKWPEEMVAFYARLARQFPRVGWEFVGCPGSLQPALSEACQGRVTCLPASWGARSRLWQWDAMLYHNPAVTESFGRTVAEAMRAGCIPIVDDDGGFREQVIEGTGWLCRSEEGFAKAVAALHGAGERRRRSRACRAHADERFSLRRFGEELLLRCCEAAEGRRAA